MNLDARMRELKETPEGVSIVSEGLRKLIEERRRDLAHIIAEKEKAIAENKNVIAENKKLIAERDKRIEALQKVMMENGLEMPVFI